MMKLTFRVERKVCLLAMSQSAEATDKSRVRLSSARLNSLKLDFRCGLMGAREGVGAAAFSSMSPEEPWREVLEAGKVV